MPPSERTRAWVDRLLRGEEGARIVAEMRAHYKTDCSLLTSISAAKRLFMTTTPSAGQANRHPSLRASLDELEGEAKRLGDADPCAAMIRAFLRADLRTKYAEWRRRPHLQPGCVHTEAVQRIFSRMRILPANMDSFRAPSATLQECIADSEEARLAKSETMNLVPNADAVLARAVALLETPPERTLSELIVALCLVSGRRFGEIASPRSRFWPMEPSYAHGVVFEGQLKQTNLRAPSAYAIPLLGATAAQFLAAVDALRSRQDPALEKRSQREISSLYQSNARKYLQTAFPEFRKTHELRAFYATCVFRAFDWKRLSEPRVLMYVLGHQNMNYFVNYNAVQVRRLTASYGEFPVDITARGDRAPRRR